MRSGMEGGRYKPLTDAQVQRIHSAALDVLEQIGLADAPPSGVALMVAKGAILGDDGEDICGLTAEQAQEVIKFLDVLQGKDKDCVECGFPSLDGVWYDGTCEDCHNEVMEKSIYAALKKHEVGNETVQS